MPTIKSPINRPAPSTAQRTALGTAPSPAQRSISSSSVKAHCAHLQQPFDKRLASLQMSAQARTLSGFELILGCHDHGFAWPYLPLRQNDPCLPKAAGIPPGTIDAGSNKSASIMVTSHHICIRTCNRAGILTCILTCINLYQCLRRRDLRGGSGIAARSCAATHSSAPCHLVTKSYYSADLAWVGIRRLRGSAGFCMTIGARCGIKYLTIPPDLPTSMLSVPPSRLPGKMSC